MPRYLIYFLKRKGNILYSYFVLNNDKSISNRIEEVTRDFSMFNSFGNSTSYNDAMTIILKRKPDLIFINFDDALENPFEFVNELNSCFEILPEFVGISTSFEFAYKALKHDFKDYLMESILELELRKLLMKFKKKQKLQTNKNLCLQSYKDFRYINTDTILFLKADNNTTDFYMIDGTVVSAFKTLKVFESTLPNNFFRIHKSYIINKNYVSRINYGKSKCTVTNTTHKLPFTKTYIDNIEFIKESLSDISISNLN
ncbi:LytTR family transcriptional regulator DNA-binding domain-containing protein [Winogradskyella undariae]|uniref:LytR/AlgR family response regulator transcription factor n=1 Tax=Winogradskyella undariae TaxID=1285465 RepID=UPI00156B4CB4|nr:LytTR family transcriptional regulator DNA-binding domain-containing protein [Winogradskyella undariae]NRR93125.1 LytTR family transcriptional regulator DNA-binding domain-containing protein [Winogradskyella undariae]